MKIDIAYSKEKQKYITAIEANELWQNGELQDKRAFTCPGKECSVKVTCKNMDKFEVDQKRVPHFIWSQQKVQHSSSCDYESIINQFREQQGINATNASSSDKKIQDEVTFDFNPENTQDLVKQISIKNNAIDKAIDKTPKDNLNNLNYQNRRVRPHYSLLSSLLNVFFDAKNDNELDNKIVKLNFETKPYTYKLSTLFKKISDNKFDEKKLKVFYGDARITKQITKQDEKYYIKFDENFVDCDAEVKCTIKVEDIFKVKNANAKLNNFDNYLNKKVQVFIMGEPYKYEVKDEKGQEKKKDIIYLNPYKNSFDLIAIK